MWQRGVPGWSEIVLRYESARGRIRLIGSKREFAISVVVGAVAQALVTWFLTAVAQLGAVIAIPVTLPIAAATFWTFWRFILPRSKGKDDAEQQRAEAAAKAMHDLGILDFVPQLRGSIFEPSSCVKMVQRKLFFIGILGSKWVIEPHVRSEFVSMLGRVAARSGSVRFLLIDPAGDYFTRLSTLRDGAISTDSIPIWQELALQHPGLEVRLYNQWPCFRLIFIDGKTLAVSRYKIDQEGYYRSKYGWEAPHVLVGVDGQWSLYDAFDLYFDQVWEKAKDVAEFG